MNHAPGAPSRNRSKVSSRQGRDLNEPPQAKLQKEGPATVAYNLEGTFSEFVRISRFTLFLIEMTGSGDSSMMTCGSSLFMNIIDR